MKLRKSNLIVLLSTITLLMLLAIQVFWIFQTAHVKEELFNEKANMVLSRTIEALGTDKETCASIGECVEMDSTVDVTSKLAKGEIKKIDSLLNHYMKFYHIHIDYTYNIGKQKAIQSLLENSFSKSTYMMPLEDISIKKGVEIKLIFPEKKQFVLAEMGLPFIISVILIIAMMIIFWNTNLLLIKEKKIAAHSTDFLNNMSHEFKTPLANIALAAKMVVKQSKANDAKKVEHYTSIILDENEKLNQQIDSVLQLNALERNEVFLHKSLFDFHELIQTAVKRMQIQIENAACSVELALNAKNSLVNGDKQQLLSVIFNLIDNAIKYANGSLLLSIETRNVNNTLVIIVSDNGIGIDTQYQQKIFEKYFRVPSQDEYHIKGFGLGLAYIKRIIELHHGQIDLHSQKGKGTSFILSLPNV